MDWSEEDQKVAVSAASAMSLKRSISSLDLAADARAARARRSALRRRAPPSNKEGLEDRQRLPPSPPTPMEDGTHNEIARRAIVERLFPNVSWDTLDWDSRADLYYYALDSGLIPPRRPRPILNDLGPVALPRIGKKEGFYYSELYPHCGCDPTKDPWSLSFSPTTDSDLAFGADPFGDGAASEDLPQPESQPDSEGEPFHCELYPHCGCEPAMLGFGCQ